MTADSVRFERALHKILWQLRQCLGDLVLIGGWVPHLYRRHGGFRDWTLETPLTSEVDLLIVPPLPIADSVTEVLNSAGFRPLNDRDAAAVWVKDPESGEQVEFLVAHRGTGRQIGKVVRVPGQKGLGAISLEGLAILARHTNQIAVPVGKFEGQLRTLNVIVPSLGAYLVNKALTFPYRRPHAGEAVNPKRAKDLIYIRNVMAAGEAIVNRIEQDAREIVRTDATSAIDVRNARNNLGLVLKGELQNVLPEAAEQLTVGFGTALGAALADLRGHLTDLFEILESLEIK